MAPQFVQQFSSALYSLQDNGAAPGWVGFVYAGTPPNPPTIDIPTSFNNGYYLFASVAPPLADTAAADAFVSAVQAWLNQNFGTGQPANFSGSACVWLPNANGPSFGPPAQTTITFFRGIGNVTSTANNFNLSIGQLTLSVPQQVVLSAIDSGLFFKSGVSGQVQFNVLEGNNAPSVANGAVLPFVGAYAGTLTMTGALSRSGNPGVIPYFETGFHYLYAVADSADQRQVYPVLAGGSSLPDLPYNGAVDPLDPFNSVVPLSAPAEGRYRTLFALAPANRDCELLPQRSRQPDQFGAAERCRRRRLSGALLRRHRASVAGCDWYARPGLHDAGRRFRARGRRRAGARRAVGSGVVAAAGPVRHRAHPACRLCSGKIVRPSAVSARSAGLRAGCFRSRPAA